MEIKTITVKQLNQVSDQAAALDATVNAFLAEKVDYVIHNIDVRPLYGYAVILFSPPR